MPPARPAMTRPAARVTVIMPAYNGARYVPAAILSLQAQTYSDWELLVIDDGSTDRTFAILQEFAEADRRIHPLQNPENLGLSRTRNRGLTEARRGDGEFFAWLDCDDLALPTRLEKQVAFLGSHPDFGAVGSWVAEIDENGVPDGRRWILNAPAAEVPALMLFRCYTAQSALTMRRSKLPVEDFDEEYPPAEDYEFAARLSWGAPLWNLPEVLCQYRRHTTNTSAVQFGRGATAVRRLFRAHLLRLGIAATEAELDLHVQLANVSTRGGTEPAAAHDWLMRLLQANRTKQVYAQVPFARVIAAQWLYVCRAATLSGGMRERLGLFLRSNLVREVGLSLPDWGGCAYRAFQKWRLGR